MEQKRIEGTTKRVKVAIIDLNDKGPVIAFLLNRIKLSAGQLSK